MTKKELIIGFFEKGYCCDLDEVKNICLGLLKENEKLKRLLENKYEKVGTLTNEILYEENTKLINQQKEFINYLQKEINQYTTHIEAIDSVCTSIYSSDYDNSKIKLAIYKEILQKYKSVIGVSDENNKQ